MMSDVRSKSARPSCSSPFVSLSPPPQNIPSLRPRTLPPPPPPCVGPALPSAPVRDREWNFPTCLWLNLHQSFLTRTYAHDLWMHAEPWEQDMSLKPSHDKDGEEGTRSFPVLTDNFKKVHVVTYNLWLSCAKIRLVKLQNHYHFYFFSVFNTVLKTLVVYRIYNLLSTFIFSLGLEVLTIHPYTSH